MARVNLRDGFGSLSVIVVKSGTKIRDPFSGLDIMVEDKNSVAVLGKLYVTQTTHNSLKSDHRIQPKQTLSCL